MRLRKGLLRPVLFIVLLCIVITGAAGWTVQDMAINPAGEQVAPGTTVIASWTVHFDAGGGTGNLTFDPSHTLVLGTDLTDARWTATLVNINKNRPPITTPLAAQSGNDYRIKGGILSYANEDVNLIITLRGTAPDITGPEEKKIAGIQELDGHLQPVAGAYSDITSLVAVPTAAETVRTPETPLKTVTIAPSPSPALPGAAATPAVKKTYSYGPDPVITILLMFLAAIVFLRRGKGRATASETGPQ